jgi:hypothetical protein
MLFCVSRGVKEFGTSFDYNPYTLFNLGMLLNRGPTPSFAIAEGRVPAHLLCELVARSIRHFHLITNPPGTVPFVFFIPLALVLQDIRTIVAAPEFAAMWA